MLSSPPPEFAARTRLRAASSRRAGLLDEPEDVLLGHHRRQPVGAEEEEVSRLDVDRDHVDVDLRIGSERAGDHGALRVGVGLLRREAAAPHQVGDERVVLGQLLQLAVADPVGARVADVTDGDAPVRQDRGGDGRAHAGGLGVGPRALVDPPVRLLDDGLDPLGGLQAVGVVVLAEGGRREARRDLARLRAAHPVGHGEERGVENEAVLVAATHAPRVRPSRAVAEPHRWYSSSVSPTCRRSPSWSLRRPSTRSPLT